MRVLAYHITWGTYGTRLHGDPRKTVDREHNEFGTPVLEYDEHRWERCKARLKYAPILSRAHMLFIEACVPSLCERGRWRFHACAAGPDHVHVVLSSQHDPETIRRLLKRWLGQELTSRSKLDGGEDRTWWAECGSIRWILDAQYFERAVGYVQRQRATP